jgi:hypothetical protein
VIGNPVSEEALFQPADPEDDAVHRLLRHAHHKNQVLDTFKAQQFCTDFQRMLNFDDLVTDVRDKKRMRISRAGFNDDITRLKNLMNSGQGIEMYHQNAGL